MIYTITLNPSIDYYLSITEPLSDTAINRADSVKMRAGGKGINVSIVLNTLSIPSTALVLLGGLMGQFIRKEIEGYGFINLLEMSAEAATRVNVKVSDKDSQYSINAEGPGVSNKTKAQLLHALNDLKENDCVMLCGSRVNGIDDMWIIELAELIQERRAKLVVDMESISLKLLEKCKPYLIKPNLYEFGLLVNRTLRDQDDAVKYLDKVLETGVENILLTMDKDGAILANRQECYHLRQSVTYNVNRVGNGDAMLGSFIGKRVLGNSYEDALRWGGAAGSATASTLGEVSLELIINELKNSDIGRINHKEKKICQEN